MFLDSVHKRCLVLGAALFFVCQHARADQPDLDGACVALNEAYKNSRTTPYYSNSGFEVEPKGTRNAYFDLRVQSAAAYQKLRSEREWEEIGRPVSSVFDSTGPKFTSCLNLGKQTLSVGETTVYSFHWHGGNISASGKAWIEQKSRRITYLIRHFPPQTDGSPQNVLEIFNYDPTRALSVSPVKGSAAPVAPPLSKSPKEDPSCSDVNDAYLQTRSARTYSETWYRVEKGGKLKPHSEYRANYAGGAWKLAVSEKWLGRERPPPVLLDKYSAIFSGCKALSPKKQGSQTFKRYSARWHNFPYEASVELWVMPDGKLWKVFYRYLDGRWEIPTEKAVAVFDYR